MVKHAELKERREASEFATYEFNRVKRAKLENERAKSGSGSGGENKQEKQKDRERANRASAAASRAKIVCYSKELEKRTDRLELERNQERRRADRAIRKLEALREDVRKLKAVLKGLWNMKDQKTVTYLVDSNALFLLQEDADRDEDESDDDQTAANNIMTSMSSLQQQHHPPMGSSSQMAHPVHRHDASRAVLLPPAPSPSALENLIHPTSLELPTGAHNSATLVDSPIREPRVSGSLPSYALTGTVVLDSRRYGSHAQEYHDGVIENQDRR